MPRQAKLRKKKIGKTTYWFTESGGEPPYFGNIADVTYADAKTQFAEHQQSLAVGAKSGKSLTALELMNHFLDWIKDHRSDSTYEQRKRDCERFANFKVNRTTMIADLPATGVTGNHLEHWLTYCQKKQKAGAQTLLHRQTSIKHCWNWASKHPSPVPYVPTTYRPFAGVERVYVPRTVLREADLINDEEISILFKAAIVDLDEFHSFGPKQARDQNPYQDFLDMLRTYYQTGARTGELAHLRVRDFLPRTQQVVLGQHKTSRTQRFQRIRHLTINDDTAVILDQHCFGKQKDDCIFTTSDNKPWKQRSLPQRFVRIKEVAVEKQLGHVRDKITIYDFRHLWIREALMAGNDIATVAHMAGTSVAVIERVYGHFRNDHLHEAQSKLDAMRHTRNR